MPRLLITITEPQDTWTRREAQRLGIPVSELIRRTLDAQRAVAAPKERSVKDMGELLYETFIPSKWLFDGCKSVAEMQARCDALKASLQAHVAEGAALEGEVSDGHAFLVTDCAKAAKKLKMLKREDDQAEEDET